MIFQHIQRDLRSSNRKGTEFSEHFLYKFIIFVRMLLTSFEILSSYIRKEFSMRKIIIGNVYPFFKYGYRRFYNTVSWIMYYDTVAIPITDEFRSLVNFVDMSDIKSDDIASIVARKHEFTHTPYEESVECGNNTIMYHAIVGPIIRMISI